MNSVRTGARFVLLITVYMLANVKCSTNRTWSRFVEQSGERRSKWLLTKCQLASEGPIMGSLGNATSGKGKVQCHLNSASPVDTDGDEWSCLLDSSSLC